MGARSARRERSAAPPVLFASRPDEEVLRGLFLAEGLETALAAMSIGLRPIWACGSAAVMRRFPVLSGIESLMILADHDANDAGDRAARETEQRWRAAGREVRTIIRDTPGDFNDALKEDSP